MNAVTGGLVGALVTGLAVFGWQSRPATAGMSVPFPQAPSAVHLASDSAACGAGLQRCSPSPQVLGPSVPASLVPAPADTVPVSVRCEPGQRAVLRHVPSASGLAATEAGCVGDTAFEGPATLGVVDPTTRPVRYVSAERVGPERVVVRERTVRRQSAERSWKKRALVIGGSAGAGAGIGALAGGKKGALLGAAIGGGAGTVYELLRK
jgi:hypothetical protein